MVTLTVRSFILRIWAISRFLSRLVLTNNTITDNSSITSGGGLYFEICENGSQIQVFNNIVWGNTSVGSGDDIFIDDDVGGDLIGASVTLSHNDYSDFIINRGDNLTQSGNINANPQLTADFHLMDGSLCVNRGENNATSLPSTDYEGEARIQNGVVDIGADESPYSKSDGGGTSSSSSGGGGGCFIATAAYGPQTEPFLTVAGSWTALKIDPAYSLTFVLPFGFVLIGFVGFKREIRPEGRV